MTPGPADDAWVALHRFVESQNRRAELAEAIGFRLGAGRGKVLFQLREGDLTLTEIASRNGLDAPYATVIVDKLEAHGLVERKAHPDDRRRKLVTLTEAGRAAIATADAILQRPPQEMSALSDDELRELTRLVDRLLAAHSDGAAG